jgi:Na+-driven multidrug efflux pump
MPIDETFFRAEGSGAGGKRRVDHTFNEHTNTTSNSFNFVYGQSQADGGIFCSEKTPPKAKPLTDQLFNEATPLIHNDSPGDDLPDDDDGDEVSWRREWRRLIQDTSPLALSALLECSLSTVSIIAVGRLGTIELGAASMASMLANFTGYMIYHGLAAALDTLCIQEFDTGMLHLVAIHFQRMVYLLLAITVPIIVLWSYAEQILPNILSNEETAILAGRYLRIIAWGTPGYALYEAAKRYIQAQGVYSASSYVLSVCAPVNAFLNWFLVWVCSSDTSFLTALTGNLTSTANWASSVLPLP